MNFNKLFEIAKQKGIEDIQVVLSNAGSKSVDTIDKAIHSLEISSLTTLSVKGIYNGHMGSYTTECINPKDFAFICDNVIESAKAITNNDKVFIYEGDKSYKKIKGEYNPELGNIPMSDKIKLAMDLASDIHKKEAVEHSETFYGETEASVVMANSKGLKLKSKKNNATAGVYTVVTKDDDTRVGIESYDSNNYQDFNKKDLVEKAHETAYTSIGAKPIESGKFSIVFSDQCTATLLSVFSGVFSSDNAQKGLSLLKGRVGEKIASSKVTIMDDPHLVGSSSSISFDSDGVATTKKALVDKGVFKGFVYSLKTAAKEGVASTGNAQGSKCGPINLYFKPGKKSKEDIISSVKYGLLISELEGAHAGVNPLSLDFSLQCTGYVIEDGKKTSPIANMVVAGNYLELLSKVKEVSNKLENGTDNPYILVSKLPVSGK